jgi:hypothetical protein
MAPRARILRPACTALVALLVAVFLPGGAAHAQSGGWSLTADLPLYVSFPRTDLAPSAPPGRFPLGLRLGVAAPFHVGLGLAWYRSGFADASAPFEGRRVTYRMVEAELRLPTSNEVSVAVGIGAGRVAFTPVTVTVTVAPLTQDFLASPVREGYLLAAYRMDERWELRLAFHILQARLGLVSNGTPGSGNLDAELFTVGAGFRF